MRADCMRTAFYFFLLCATLSAFTQAQESPTPSASPAASSTRTVRLSFVPPPLEGTFSLGIYDQDNKLVRILHREADLSEFAIGHDALNTSWDGKNDAGELLPAGKYRARGCVVGDLKIEGVGYFFNDWVTDENSPRIRRIENFACASAEQLMLLVTLNDGKQKAIACDSSGRIIRSNNDAASDSFDDLVSPKRLKVRAASGKLSLWINDKEQTVAWSNLVAPESAAFGKDENVWVVDRVEAGSADTELKEFSKGGEFLRRLAVEPGQPRPTIVRASTTEDKVFLLEQNQAVQQLRGLALLATKKEGTAGEQQVSDWKIFLEKRIVAHHDFSLVNGRPEVSSTNGKSAPEKVAIKLRANDLISDKHPRIEIVADFDEDGSYLKTSDGLPLRTISETARLNRVLFAADGDKAINVFQDDGAVVEQFRVSDLDQMMEFDCGDFELK
jgi:hypothetical protein